MRLIDHTFSSPPANLACDEALLDCLEEGDAGETLRFWEPVRHFVVLGSSNRAEREVHLDRCAADGVQVLRRHSGGGTVLQGPGCLNYSLILRIGPHGPTRNITETTAHVMSRHAAAISRLTGEKVEMKGSSDLTISGMKFSGNAQRRRLKALLFHGTFLLSFDLGLIEKYIKLPPKQPEYRRQRGHLEFVRNLSADSASMKQCLADIWNADRPQGNLPLERINELVVKKYSAETWNFRL